MTINRVWAMPNKDTFSVKPIGEFVKKYLRESKVSIDPFARNKDWFTYTNDLNPATQAQYHLEAGEFLDLLIKDGVKADLVILDPPYSPRQVKECYESIGKKMQMSDAWTDHHRKIWKDKIDLLLNKGGRVLTFGWNTVGMGLKRKYEIEEILICCHGAGHNDTISMSEIKL